MKLKVSSILLLFAINQALSQTSKKTIVNLDTVSYHGTTDTVAYMPLQMNADGKVVLSGNEKMSSTQYNSTTISLLSDASNAWISSFNPSTSKCFVVASTHDASGNIYNVGAIRVAGSANGLDFFVQKLNSGGTVLWTSYYNGPASLNDLAIAVYVDAGGNVFVTGASDGGASTLVDYATIRYDSSGAQQWVSRYNYSNYMDVPTGISQAGSNIIVSGSSGTSFLNADFATVAYDLSGSQVSARRDANTNIGAQDRITSMATDSIGNVYVVGTTFNGNNYDMQVQKLDTALNVTWSQVFDGFNLNLNDAAVSLALDDSLNIYVTGYSYINATNRQMMVIKYNSSGVKIWDTAPAYGKCTSSEGLRIKVKSGTEIFVGGNITSGSSQDLYLVRLNSGGRTLFNKQYDDAGTDDKFMDLTYDTASHVYLSARSNAGAVDKNVLVAYHYWDKEITPVKDTVAGINYVDHEVIAGFIKPVLKMSAINNKNLQFGNLNDFVADTTCDKLSYLFDPGRKLGINARNFKVQKIFTQMTGADTLAQSRMGDWVQVPPFYTKLLVTLPSSVDVLMAAGSLKYINPDMYASQLNFTYDIFSPPNDTLYPGQSALHPNVAYPNAHISIERAWENYTKGNSNIKVGVYDTGLYTYHDDFSGLLWDTRDYILDLGLDYNGHGSKVASIIAAKTNNTTGMSGVAGGDNNTVPFSPVNKGVHLYNFKVLEPAPAGAGLCSTALLIQAYKDGADSMGLHVMNHSYGNITDSLDEAMVEGINYINKMGIAFVAARGNVSPAQPYSITQWSAPACLKPGKVMNVGASGTDGHYHLSNVNGNAFSSMQGKHLDFLAPGDTANVTVIKPILPPPRPAGTASTPSQYTKFNGTSASAPYVTGVTALMMSYRNASVSAWDNLVHEDCEALLKRTATDLQLSSPYNEAPGYDTVSGYGLIKADSALSAVQFQYKIRHIDKSHYATSVSTSTSMVASNVIRWFWGQPTGPIFAGSYYCDIVEVTTTYGYNFSGETYLDSWPLYKASTGYQQNYTGAAPEIPSKDDPSWVELVSSNLTSAVVKTYVYHITANNGPQILPTGWVPVAPNNINSAFTLYSLGDPLTGIKQNSQANVDYFNVHPNPSAGQFTIGYNSQKVSKGKVIVTDLTGRTVYEDDNCQVKFGLNRSELNLSHLPKGIYFLNLEIENNKQMVKKIIIE